MRVQATFRVIITRPASTGGVLTIEQNVELLATSGVAALWDLREYVRQSEGAPFAVELVTLTPTLLQLGFSFTPATGVLAYDGTPMTFTDRFEGEVTIAADDGKAQ